MNISVIMFHVSLALHIDNGGGATLRHELPYKKLQNSSRKQELFVKHLYPICAASSTSPPPHPPQKKIYIYFALDLWVSSDLA